MDPRIETALAELREMILARWPSATFQVSRDWDDPREIFLEARVEADDLEEIHDAVIGRVFEFQDAELPIHVMPLPPLERVLEQLRAERAARKKARRSWLPPLPL